MSDDALDLDDAERGRATTSTTTTTRRQHASRPPTPARVLEYLVRAVVDDPDAVEVEVDEGGRRTTLNVTVGDGDMGRVIGKRGRVAQASAPSPAAAAVRDGVEVDIEFVD